MSFAAAEKKSAVAELLFRTSCSARARGYARFDPSARLSRRSEAFRFAFEEPSPDCSETVDYAAPMLSFQPDESPSVGIDGSADQKQDARSLIAGNMGSGGATFVPAHLKRRAVNLQQLFVTAA